MKLEEKRSISIVESMFKRNKLKKKGKDEQKLEGNKKKRGGNQKGGTYVISTSRDQKKKNMRTPALGKSRGTKKCYTMAEDLTTRKTCIFTCTYL